MGNAATEHQKSAPGTLTVFCAGAMKAAITRLASGFETQTGHQVQFTFGAVGTLKAKVLAGAAVDVLIFSRPALEQLERDGKLSGRAIAELGRVGVGIAVRDDVALPSVSTAEALRQSLMAATSISYGDPALGDSSGVHFSHVLERLGVTAQVKAKTVLAPSGLGVAALVREGKVVLGATQASVIAACDGIALAGLLPADLQHITTYCSSVSADAASPEAAMLFVDYLSTPSARSILAGAGLEQ